MPDFAVIRLIGGTEYEYLTYNDDIPEKWSRKETKAARLTYERAQEIATNLNNSYRRNNDTMKCRILIL